MKVTATLVDQVLEASVVGSFSKIGYDVRRRVARWSPAPSLAGRHVLITGATSGIGHECASQLARLGATLRFVARDEDRARRAREQFLAVSTSGEVEYVLGDVSTFAAVREIAAWSLEKSPTLDVLIHNAGAITERPTRSADGYELTVAAQLLGPYLLTGLVLPSLQRAASGRVLTVSSGGMYAQRFDLDYLDEIRDYDGVKTYARVKRAQVVLNHEWARRVAAKDVAFFALHPGWVDTPGVRASLPGFYRVTRPILRSPSQGADTMVWLAGGGDLAELAVSPSGRFWFDRRTRGEYKAPWTRPRDARTDQERLWAWCAERTQWAGPESVGPS